MSSLKAQLELAADATGVESGVSKAKRSLKDLGATAQAAGAQSAAGIDKVPLATGRAAKAIDRIVEKYRFQALTIDKTTTETALFELQQRGATKAQIEAAQAALKSVDAYKQQELALARTQDIAKKFSAVLATLSVTALVGFAAAIRRSIADIDAFNDLKDATGASIETISALDRIARETGGTFDQVSSILTKFNQALKDVDSNKRIGTVFKALNLDVAELKRLDPAEALRRTAVALSTFADDGGKARAVQELFGRSVREIAPLLKDLSEKTTLVASTTTEAAAEAERFGKEMAKFSANVGDAERAISTRLVVALNQLIDRFRLTSREGKGLFEFLASEYQRIGQEQRDMLFGAEDPVRRLVEVNKDLAEVLENQATARRDNRAQYQERIDDLKAEAENLREVIRLRGRSSLAVLGPTKPDTTPSLKIPEEQPGTKTDPLAEAKRYLESLQKQIEKTRDLTVYEQALADISQKRLGKLTPELERSILATARQVDVSNQAKAALEGMTTARQKAAEMLERADNAALASVQQQIEGNQALRDEIELIGLSVTARAAVEQARLSSAIALKEEELAMARNAEASATQISALEREIALLKERQGLLGERGRRVAAVEARDRAKEFSDGVRDDLKRAFSDAFRDTKNPIKAFGESLYNTITARVASALAESLATKALGFLGLSISGARAEGGPVSAGKTYLVGERGMELFTPNTSGTITSNEDLAGAMASRSGPNIHITNNYTVGDVATISMVRQAVAGSEARIASSLNRSMKYGGAPV